ncbi:MAG: aldehyde ferredoxin oxidoreductase N-terminal domain-containing protein [Spirochaetaceae bacterium]|nr:aldehyde ferredoxin oxidoreductase N-terminal domain-containing protein [Spirochaetaceae bacterium]
MPAAYTGKILSVDLSEGLVHDQAIADGVYRRFRGGMGLGVWYLYDRIPAGADALGPDNILGFVPGLLTGSGSLYTGRWTACAKSPLTGGWAWRPGREAMPRENRPVSCLELEFARPSDRHAKPVLARPAACISCAMCERTCPVGAVSMIRYETASAAGA